MRAVPFVLLLAFVVVPLLELFVILQVGELIGGWQTVGLLLLVSVLGSVLVRREGRRAWTAFRSALGSGRLPSREIADGLLVVVGGTLLLTPGFLTDIVGLVLLFPLTRPLARRLLLWAVAGRVLGPARGAAATRVLGGRGPRPRRGSGPAGGRWSDRGTRVVPGEVVDDGRPGDRGRPGDDPPGRGGQRR